MVIFLFFSVKFNYFIILILKILVERSKYFKGKKKENQLLALDIWLGNNTTI